jgi:hypothetical protein
METQRLMSRIGLALVILVAAACISPPTSTPAAIVQPTATPTELSQPAAITTPFSRIFSGLQPDVTTSANPFGRTLALLGPRNLGTELVMEVRSSEGNYWQGVIYDQYTGMAFQSSDTQRILASADELALPQQFEQCELITQTVVIHFSTDTLIFAAPQPVAVNQAGWIELLPGNNLNMWTTLTPFTSGDMYRVVSSVSRATVEQLRSAGNNYPAMVRERYLQLPDTLPQRVRDLAKKILADAQATNPYDQASALESWLRKNIKYNDQIPAPPQGQDGVDYVLFVTQQGYCDYYASAMAVMARSLGIPSRIATGYAQGQFDPNLNVYEIYQDNAHTWPEIYFPKYGWIQFEPTANQPTVDRRGHP